MLYEVKPKEKYNMENQDKYTPKLQPRQVIKCPHCDVSLTSHRGGKLVCHYCGYEEAEYTVCPECGSKHIGGFRAGTQQIEDLVKAEKKLMENK